MNFLLVAIFIVGLIISGLIGWKYRSIVGFLLCLALTLGVIAIIPPQDDTPNAQRDVGEQPNIPTLDPLASLDPIENGLRIPESPDPAREPAPMLNPDLSGGLTLAKLQPFRPKEVTTHGYVGSDACIECHPNNHATWDASYHSKMTQVAEPSIVLGNFDNVTVMSQGREYILTKNGDVCTVNMPDEHDPTKRVSAPVVMTTGSHTMQVYWFATGKKRLLGMFPLIFLNESQEWVPREAAFLVPPHHTPSFEIGRWNDTCSECHSTHRKGRRLASGEWDTHVGEFGISCESCHGPGQDHIVFQRQPVSDPSTSNSVGNVADIAADMAKSDPIVNPIDLPKVKASQVCGQCHSVMDPLNPDLHSQENGHDYRPGKDLAETHGVWNRDTPEYTSTMESLDYPDLDTLLNETYYPDGMIRVSGREYNGLLESSCYINGEMTCMSCHKMHKDESDTRYLTEWANDQLHPKAIGNQACTQCHQADQYATAHTHHAVGSTGSNCYNCHMPHTAYGLLKAIRNHQISNPDVAKDHKVQRPNACNLCHLDRTLEWAAVHLDTWYSIEPPELGDDEKEIAASLIWLLKGNAAERAISAWHMGWPDAQQASGKEWQLPFLTALLDDDYEAIRLIARRSIKTLPDMADFTMDVVTSSTSPQREKAAFELLQGWLNLESSKQIDRPELLIRKESGIQIDRLRALIDKRDNSRILLGE